MTTWYRTGTVAVTNGSPNVVGTGTLWNSQASQGDIFIGPDLALYEITSVTDDTHLAIKKLDGTASYNGATLSAQGYAIVRNFTSTLPAQLAADLAALMQKYHVTLDELVAWLSGTGTVTVHDAVGNAYSVKTPAQLLADNNAAAATIFSKALSTSPAFIKTGAGTVSVLAKTSAMVAGNLISFAVNTAVTMPALTAGTDYAIYFCTDGTVRADANFSAPTGYTTANSRKIGGFHYAPGGNATGVAGGDTTPAINAYSIWDLKFRPACPDPRGMCLVADDFWADIYLLGVDHPTNGSSKYNVTIADGVNPPKIPAKFGGNGTTAYGNGNWWNLGEVLHSFGKRHPSYAEFAALAYGTTEAASATAATDPVSTVLRAESTSKWGVMLSTGNMWVWGSDFGGPYGTAAWTANTNGGGSTYNLSNAVLLGGGWTSGANAGSRCSIWVNAPTVSINDIGARGVCDHLQLD